MNKDYLYYLSHPYTTYGDSETNRYVASVFERCVNDMYQITIVNPIVIIPIGTEDTIAMVICRKLFDACEAIILCPNWDKSKGCLEEYQWAIHTNKPIFILHQDLTITEYQKAS